MYASSQVSPVWNLQPPPLGADRPPAALCGPSPLRRSPGPPRHFQIENTPDGWLCFLYEGRGQFQREMGRGLFGTSDDDYLDAFAFGDEWLQASCFQDAWGHS